ncbi:MAG: hypothetical protein WD904_05975 [Dehalococcoidia bacterium]
MTSTNETLRVEVNDRGEVELPREESTDIGYTIVGDEPIHVEVRTADGRIVLQLDSNMNLLNEQNGRRIEISTEALTRCATS